MIIHADGNIRRWITTWHCSHCKTVVSQGWARRPVRHDRRCRECPQYEEKWFWCHGCGEHIDATVTRVWDDRVAMTGVTG